MIIHLELTSDAGVRITGGEYSFDHDPDAMACYLDGRAALETSYEALEDDPEPEPAPAPAPEPEPGPAPRAFGRTIGAREHPGE